MQDTDQLKCKPLYYANTAIRLTANGGNFTGGVIRTTLQYLKPRGPWTW